jgi:copper chaperone CopZ
VKSILLAFSLFFTLIVFSQAAKKESFKVQGNCAMCKKHIESAATSMPGVSSAVWNKNTKLFTITYQPSKVSVDSIQSKIAAAGYDTPKFRGDDGAYSELDECCKYDRVKKSVDKKN